MDAITAAHDGKVQLVDTSIVRVHQHGAPAKKRGRDRCVGRSRGGLTTKVHALVDAKGRPIKLSLTAGQKSDIEAAPSLMADISADAMFLAEKGYDASGLRAAVTARGA